ncbi:ABC transporter substrate-binding protein [Tomitella cavernea]|uniref:ABC transporter substrate-binding protein n=1 Tax=Tomitella cavernea TaxID=1387982 RepID=A0ABP9C5Y8_9ACTN|nr:ABC transporter substrate-binding protein [Tomitella cavernea]
MRKRSWLVGLVVLLVGVLTLSACAGGGGSAGSAGNSGKLTIGSIAGPQTFDPVNSKVGHAVLFLQPVYDSLLRREPDGSLVPMLATDWKYNADRTQLTLTIRSGVTFTDGTPVNAEAVKVNLDRFRTGNGPDANKLSRVENVETQGDSTVILTLSDRDPSLLENLGNSAGFIASPAAIEAGNIGTDPVGSGPYTLDSANSVDGSEYTYVKNPDYWDESLQKYDTIVIKQFNDTTSMLNALLSGQIEAGPLTPNTAEQAKNAGMTEYRYSTDWQGLLIFDRDGSNVPALKDPRVRQAINYAIDKKALLDQVLNGYGTVTSQILPPSADGFAPDLDTAYPFDPEKARQLLADAGYADGFAVEMPTVSGLFPQSLVAGLGTYLGDVGIDVKWQPIQVTDLVSSLVQGKYAMSWYSLFQGSAWVTATQAILPEATYNPFHSSTPEVAATLQKLQDGDDAQQAEAAADLNAEMTEQAWFAPFYRKDEVYFTAAGTTTKPQAQQVVPSIYNFAPAQ